MRKSKKYIFSISTVLIVLLSFIRCGAPGATKSRSLAVVESEMSVRVSSLLGDTAKDDPQQDQYSNLAISGDSSKIILASCEQYPEIIAVWVYIYNGDSTSSIYFDPENAFLKDGFSILVRNLYPHEAANMMIAHVSEIPPYTPKYNYEMSSRTQGSLTMYDYGTGYYSGDYNSNTQSEVTAKEDPWNKLGWSIGAAIAEHNNSHFWATADYFYSTGLVPTKIPPVTAISGLLLWRNRVSVFPITVVVPIEGDNYTFVFDRPDN